MIESEKNREKCKEQKLIFYAKQRRFVNNNNNNNKIKRNDKQHTYFSLN